MWVCAKCGERLEEQFGSCWRCSTVRPAQAGAVSSPTSAEPAKWKLSYRFFRGTLATWDDLFTKAAYFATEIGPERVLNISHSVDDADGVVTVWYWDAPEEAADTPPPAPPSS